MPKVTVEHVLGFLDGRIFQVQTALIGSSLEAYDRGRLQAYEDLKAYILIEGLDPE